MRKKLKKTRNESIQEKIDSIQGGSSKNTQVLLDSMRFDPDDSVTVICPECARRIEMYFEYTCEYVCPCRWGGGMVIVKHDIM
jgi:hypothetical protein